MFKRDNKVNKVAKVKTMWLGLMGAGIFWAYFYNCSFLSKDSKCKTWQALSKRGDTFC